MYGIVILLRDNHYRPMTAIWMLDLCSFTGSLMEKNNEVSFDVTYSYGF